MNKRMREILGLIEKKKEEARTYLESKEIDKAKALSEEIKELNKEFREEMESIEEDKRNVMKDFGDNNGTIKGIVDGQFRSFRRGQKISNVYRNDDNLSLGKYVRGIVTGEWGGASKEERESRSVALGTGNIIVPKPLSSQIVDMARNKSILLNEVDIVEMTSNTLTIGRLKTDPEFGFKAELEATTNKNMEFEPITLKTKTAYGLVKVSLEAIYSAENLDQLVLNAMAESMARTIDKACLFGATETEPKGILTYTDINVVNETTELSNYSPFIKAIGDIRRANGNPTQMAVNATIDEKMNLLTNTNGDPLGIPEAVSGLNRVVSNQLPDDEGVGLNESTAMVYDPKSIVIGMRLPIGLQVSDSAGDAYETGSVYLRVVSMLDIAVLRPKHITKITGLK